jgi:hypothetical protein
MNSIGPPAEPGNGKSSTRPSNRGQIQNISGDTVAASLDFCNRQNWKQLNLAFERSSTNDLETDSWIEERLRFLAPAIGLMSDDPVVRRNYYFAHVAYAEFRKSGSQENRYLTWQAIEEACRWASKNPHSKTKGTSSNAILGQRRASESHGGADK